MQSHIHLGSKTTRAMIVHSLDGLLMDLEARAEDFGGQVDWTSLTTEIEVVELKTFADVTVQQTLVLRADANVADKEEE